MQLYNLTMKHNPRPFAAIVCASLALAGRAQDKLSEFNPVDHAVISQTIAPDARSAGMGDVGVFPKHGVKVTTTEQDNSVRMLLSYPF